MKNKKIEIKYRKLGNGKSSMYHHNSIDWEVLIYIRPHGGYACWVRNKNTICATGNGYHCKYYTTPKKAMLDVEQTLIPQTFI